MRHGLVTVVVPVYKTERYLDQCIESIVGQTYADLEILLIDDGSPDNCPAICDQWAARDSRIRVIHKTNAGLGMARNTGIENASGEYICFFDSDDYVDPKTIELAYESCKKERADIAVFGFANVDSQGVQTKKSVLRPPKKVYSGQEVQQSFLPDLIGTDPKTGNATNLCMSACMMLCSTELIRKSGWAFSSERDIISEDVYSLIGLYQYVQRVVILEDVLYFYRENPKSLTHTYREDRFEKVKYFYQECVKLCRHCGYGPEAQRRCAEPFVSFVIALLKQEAEYHSSRKEALARIRQIISDELLQEVLRQKKKEKTGFSRKILYWTIRNRQYMLCYCLLVAKNSGKG